MHMLKLKGKLFKRVLRLILNYHINYGAIRGFPALRKFVTTHVKKNNTFSRVFDIANQLLKRHSPFAPLMLMNEEQSLHHS